MFFITRNSPRDQPYFLSCILNLLAAPVGLFHVSPLLFVVLLVYWDLVSACNLAGGLVCFSMGSMSFWYFLHAVPGFVHLHAHL